MSTLSLDSPARATDPWQHFLTNFEEGYSGLVALAHKAIRTVPRPVGVHYIPDDAVQEAITEVYEHYTQWNNGRAKASTWAFAVMRHTLVRMFKRLEREQHEPLDSHLLADEDDEVMAEHMARKELAAEIFLRADKATQNSLRKMINLERLSESDRRRIRKFKQECNQDAELKSQAEGLI